MQQPVSHEGQERHLLVQPIPLIQPGSTQVYEAT
jgi:hypothetical protein